MDIVLWVILAAIFIILWILMWRRAGRFKKCRGCRHFAEQYITSLHGQGLFRFGYCQLVIYDTRIVEPDIKRECAGYEVLEEVTQGMAEAEKQRVLEGKKRPRNPKVSLFGP